MDGFNVGLIVVVILSIVAYIAQNIMVKKLWQTKGINLSSNRIILGMAGLGFFILCVFIYGKSLGMSLGSVMGDLGTIGWVIAIITIACFGNVKKCAVGKHPKSEKLGGIESGRRLRLRPLPVLHRRQSQRVARIDPNAVVVDKNIAENDRFDLFSRQLVCRNLVDLLFFERGKKALHPCVVEAMSGAAEALYHAAARQLGTKG